MRFEHVQPRDAASSAAVYARALEIERDTWKTASGNGVDRGPMREFYARMLPRLARARASCARSSRRATAWTSAICTAAPRASLFRGLQFSFREAARSLGLGNALQAEMIDALCAEGFALYDLGSQSEYKRHWGEVGLVDGRPARATPALSSGAPAREPARRVGADS